MRVLHAGGTPSRERHEPRDAHRNPACILVGRLLGGPRRLPPPRRRPRASAPGRSPGTGRPGGLRGRAPPASGDGGRRPERALRAARRPAAGAGPSGRAARLPFRRPRRAARRAGGGAPRMPGGWLLWRTRSAGAWRRGAARAGRARRAPARGVHGPDGAGGSRRRARRIRAPAPRRRLWSRVAFPCRARHGLDLRRRRALGARGRPSPRPIEDSSCTQEGGGL